MIEIPNQELIAISDLKVDGQNPNRMTDRQRKSLVESIQRYGFIVPIITNKDLLIADGEQRWEVAKGLSMAQVPVIRLPVEDVDRRLLRQVLNKLRGEHELLLDAQEFDRIISMGHEDDLKQLLDLSDSQIERYLNEIREPKEETYEIPEIEKITTSIQRGDIYALGKHRLMCGDSTTSDLSCLMHNKQADMLFTDPPYGFEVFGAEKNRKYNTAYLPKYEKWVPQLKEVTKADSVCAIWENWRHIPRLWQILEEQYKIINLVIWFATNRHQAYHQKWFYNHYEPLIVGAKGNYYFDFDYAKAKGTTDVLSHIVDSIHTTNENVVFGTKPVKLHLPLLNIYTKKGDLILDLFGGSGSTLIACEQTNRICYMMEIEPRYCQIIINRWEAYTGKKAIKVD